MAKGESQNDDGCCCYYYYFVIGERLNCWLAMLCEGGRSGVAVALPIALCGRGQGYINKLLNGHTASALASRDRPTHRASDRIDGIKLNPCVSFWYPAGPVSSARDTAASHLPPRCITTFQGAGSGRKFRWTLEFLIITNGERQSSYTCGI